MTKQKAGFSLEKALRRLQEIVDILDDTDTTLEQSLKYYEEGITLIQQCAEELSGAQKKLLELRQRADNTFELIRLEE